MSLWGNPLLVQGTQEASRSPAGFPKLTQAHTRCNGAVNAGVVLPRGVGSAQMHRQRKRSGLCPESKDDRKDELRAGDLGPSALQCCMVFVCLCVLPFLCSLLFVQGCILGKYLWRKCERELPFAGLMLHCGVFLHPRFPLLR